ncbi:hypothetical protein U14_03140 [Candidatus Moduliflexus flocculans]|uniref:Uncharacterized protein n=1 Tax=Candidatus Moduliflexus flocculans TaxID=1499966 RepID=A0A081BNC8_9BACT|nr:hypothetical protein U14_03140 [Candidatus Moduliflexus flocculans]
MNQSQIRRDELLFVVEPDEQRFLAMLRVRLLEEGCNLPVSLAARRFYSALFRRLSEQCSSGKTADEPRTHAEFYAAIRAQISRLENAEQTIACEATRAIDSVVQAWQLDDACFQESGEQFLDRLQMIIAELWQANGMSPADADADRLRRRLYLTLTTALVSKIRARTEFLREFGSIPRLLAAMTADHAEFCRFMAFCREHSPYVLFLVSQTFWRTVETFRLETRDALA